MLAALLVLVPRLGDRFLWEDEAETALLARNVLRFGVPVGWDGRDLVSQECGADLDANGLWRQSPWLAVYLVAASFRVLGADAFAARLPFVLLAVGTLPALWLLASRLFADRRIALLAPLALALSVPFLLYARQGRYYSLAAFAVVWVLLGFVAAVRGGRGGVLGLVAALSVLFHANYVIGAATVAGLGLALGALRPDRAALGRLGIAGGATAALNAPWLLVFDVAGQAATSLRLGGAGPFAARLGGHLSAIELYMFPALLIGPAVALTLLASRHRAARAGGDVALALAVFAAGYVGALALSPLPFVRYLVGLLPVFALLLAWAVALLARAHAAIAVLVFALAVGVDRADLARLSLGSPLAKYVDEITHDFEGPVEALARLLARDADRDARVFATYGALALRFHTGLEVRGGTGCQPLEGWPPPDWIVVRAFFRLNPIAAGGAADAERVRAWVNARILSGEYRRIELPVVDVAHDARPDPDLHLYRMPRDGRRVAIWKHARAGRPGR